jgi:hypothetical protein
MITPHRPRYGQEVRVYKCIEPFIWPSPKRRLGEGFQIAYLQGGWEFLLKPSEKVFGRAFSEKQDKGEKCIQ